MHQEIQGEGETDTERDTETHTEQNVLETDGRRQSRQGTERGPKGREGKCFKREKWHHLI